MVHNWTQEDDIVVLYLYKFGNDLLPYTLESIAKRRGMTLSSLKMRIGNMRAIAGDGGLAHYGLITKSVYDRFHRMPEPEMKRLAFPDL